NAMSIDQASARGVIDWNTFSIADGREVRINNADGATLNRVLAGQVSQIEGQLSATGSVYLMNPHGVIVGPGGRVVTGGDFVATTRNVDANAFMAGGAVAVRGDSPGDIANHGSIVSRNGNVVLIARSVSNDGTISAARGATLAAADEVLLTTTED